MGVHSKYSPSGMKDLLACPGRLLATLGMDGGSSPAAERGTECHDRAEKLLPGYLVNEDCPDTFGPWKADWQEQCTEDMLKHAVDEFEIHSILADTNYYLEKQVNLGWIKVDGFDMAQVFGTCDVMFYCHFTKTLIVLDYKTGVGIAVYPKMNPQLMIYALGAIGFVQDQGFEVETVRICISQPRLQKELLVWVTNPSELGRWAQDILIPGLIEMSQPDAKRIPGLNQCRYCPIKGSCNAQKKEALDMLDSAPTPKTLEETELDELLLKLPQIKQWIKHVEARALVEMQDGKKLPNFKLVRGKSNRVWADPVKADTFLKHQKLKEKERYKFTLISPAQVEKVLAKKLEKTVTLNRFLGLVTKPEGRVSFALRSDPRKEIVINKTEGLIDLDDLI